MRTFLPFSILPEKVFQRILDDVIRDMEDSAGIEGKKKEGKPLHKILRKEVRRQYRTVFLCTDHIKMLYDADDAYRDPHAIIVYMDGTRWVIEGAALDAVSRIRSHQASRSS